MLKSYNSVEEAVRECFGNHVTVEKCIDRFGGDINEAQILYLSNKERVFLKSNTIKNRAFFDAEEEGLTAIAATKTIATPKLICKGTDERKSVSFLMMEVIEGGGPGRSAYTTLGYEFASLHQADTESFVRGGQYGFWHDNFIGASVQINTPKESWIDFFRECRLEVQIKMAEKILDKETLKAALRLLDSLDLYLTEPSQPSLLHGDMWGGNYMMNNAGKAVLIDPAAYVGCAEADMAMTEMFRPMPGDFYKAYYEKNPMGEGYNDRKDLYNLYHWLNHLNLFGGGYYDAVVRIIRRYR